MKLDNFTFFTKEQCCLDQKLDILKKRGIRAEVTDFSLLLRARVQEIDDEILESQKKWYWTSSFLNENVVYVIADEALRLCWLYSSGREISARPTLSYQKIEDIILSGAFQRANDGVLELLYGFYPQTVADVRTQNILNNWWKRDKLSMTGNIFTIDSSLIDRFCPELLIEYEYNGKKYVRLNSKAECVFSRESLSYLENKNSIWIEVEPVRWLVDEEAQVMISEKLLFAGVRYVDSRKFMNDILAKDLVRGSRRNMILKPSCKEDKCLLFDEIVSKKEDVIEDKAKKLIKDYRREVF